MTPDQRLFDRVHGALLALACGDALGAPTETMTPEEILAATGGKGVTGYCAPLQSKIKDTMALPQGGTTDDTQLTLAVADSLLHRGRFDLRDQGRALVEARFGTAIPTTLRRLLPSFIARGTVSNRAKDCSWKGTGMRWGSTTEASVLELAKHFAYANEKGDMDKGRDPERVVAYEHGKGGGNGPGMKVAPLAIVYPPVAWDASQRMLVHRREDVFAAYAFNLARQTHGDVVPAHGSVAIGAAIATMLALPEDADRLLAKAELQRRVVTVTKTRESLDRFIPQYTKLFDQGKTLSNRIVDACRASERSVEDLRRVVGNGFLTVESIPFTIGIARRNVDDVEAALLEAVNAGGDADTNAAMTGAIVGARVGASRIPKELVNGLSRGVRADIEHAAKGLCVLRAKFLAHPA